MNGVRRFLGGGVQLTINTTTASTTSHTAKATSKTISGLLTDLPLRCQIPQQHPRPRHPQGPDQTVSGGVSDEREGPRKYFCSLHSVHVNVCFRRLAHGQRRVFQCHHLTFQC